MKKKINKKPIYKKPVYKNTVYKNTISRKLIAQLFTLITVVLFSFNVAAEPIDAILVKDVQLRSAPAIKATTVGILLKNSPVKIVQRNGGWYQVTTANKITAWLSMLDVRFKSRSLENSRKSNTKGFVNLRQGHSVVTATTGVRGIGESDIKNSKPDFVGLVHAQNFIVSAQQAKEFAKQVSLESQTIAFLEKADE